MRTVLICTLCLFLAGAVSVSAEEQLDLNDKNVKESYSLGVSIGRTLKNQSLDMHYDALFRGIKDALSDDKILMTDQEINDTLKSVQRQLAEQREAERKEMAEKNLALGEEFLNANKEKEGVVSLPSGLQYKILTEGSGETPQASDTVTVHYSGTLVDGTEFDSSYKRGEPAVFNVSGIIPGLAEALQLMKPGAKWKVFIPAHLAYGERGAGRTIGPNETLIFDIELISFEKGSKFHTDKIQP